MAKLYELINEIENFNFEIDEETGEILNVIALEELELERDIRIENLCLWVKNLRAEAEAYKNEMQSFQKRKKQAENKANSLEKYIEFALGGQKFKTDRVSVTYRKSTVVECDDLFKVPEEYLRYKVPELDKTAVKTALKDGKEIDGCTLIEKQNMSIK